MLIIHSKSAEQRTRSKEQINSPPDGTLLQNLTSMTSQLIHMMSKNSQQTVCIFSDGVQLHHCPLHNIHTSIPHKNLLIVTSCGCFCFTVQNNIYAKIHTRRLFSHSYTEGGKFLCVGDLQYKCKTPTLNFYDYT